MSKFIDEEVSPWGGLLVIEETYCRSGLEQYLEEKYTDLPVLGGLLGKYVSENDIEALCQTKTMAVFGGMTLESFDLSPPFRISNVKVGFKIR